MKYSCKSPGCITCRNAGRPDPDEPKPEDLRVVGVDPAAGSDYSASQILRAQLGNIQPSAAQVGNSVSASRSYGMGAMSYENFEQMVALRRKDRIRQMRERLAAEFAESQAHSWRQIGEMVLVKIRRWFK